ncbi:MAG: nuclear pore complex Nup98-Nup96-like, partial [Trebouxia sp. A1-2]
QAAADGIKRANHHSRLSGIQHVAQLLSGHQTAAATILAASMGDVRLATLVSQTGVSSSARQLIERQLDTWQSQTWEGEAYANHIDPDCLLIYQLLAGQLQQVIPRLDLDWRRALGLHFWYHQPTTASISDLLDSYSDSVSSDRDGVPQPKPLYQEAAGVQQPRSSTAANAVDFQLLRLAAGDLLGTQPAVGLAELLRPAGVTPDPLDHSFAWQLLSVLQAVDAVALEDDNGCSPTQVFQLHMSLISEIEALGHMSHWAVYVALHMPGHPSQEWSHLRESVVRELLLRHAPEWAPDASKRGFLLHKLHIPPAWLDQSLAQWSRYCRDDSGELQHLMEAGLWVEAHQLLCIHLAPQLFLASHTQEGRIPSEQQQQLEAELQQLISRLTSHAERISAQAGSRLQPDAELNAVSWSQGVGLYATFFELRDAFRHARGDESGQQQRMHDYLQFAQQLQHVAPIWRAGSGSTLRQVVLSELSAQVTKWLLKDASPVAQQQPQDIALTGFGTSSSMLNIQLATNWLAQCAG